MALADLHCEAIPAGVPPLPNEEATRLSGEIPLWSLRDATLTREWTFKDFPHAMEFVDRVAGIAQQENHHPDIYISYNKVRLELSTHKIGGLSMNDFILAAKIDRLLEEEWRNQFAA